MVEALYCWQTGPPFRQVKTVKTIVQPPTEECLQLRGVIGSAGDGDDPGRSACVLLWTETLAVQFSGWRGAASHVHIM